MMLPLGNGTLLDVCIRNALTSCKHVILVIGTNGQTLIPRYSDCPDITTTVNPTAEIGLFSSTQCGLKQIKHAYTFISHGDMPSLSPVIFQALWQARGEHAVLPTYDGRNGHPVLLPKEMAQRMSAVPPEGSAKNWLLQNSHRFLPLEDPGILLDIDTPEQYQAFCREFSSISDQLDRPTTDIEGNQCDCDQHGTDIQSLEIARNNAANDQGSKTEHDTGNDIGG